MANLLDGLSSVNALTSAPFATGFDKLVSDAKSITSADVPATITQSERLFTTRSRSVNNLEGGGDRGERAYIKILTTNTDNSLNRNSSQSHGSSQPTSLGTSSGGVLQEAVTGNGYASFLLTDVACTLEEKLQVVEVFGDAEVSYYFGRQPIMFNLSGLLIDSVDNNWFIEWLEMYSHVMRGTELARNYELVRIVLPNMTIEGTINRMSWNQNSARDVDIPFQFSFLAKQIVPKPVTLPNKPLTNDPVINFGKAEGFLSQSGQNNIKMNSLQDNIRGLQAVISDPGSSIKDFASSLTNLGSSGVNGYYSSTQISSSRNGGGSGLFSGVNSNLSGVRASLFSPVYGVLSSLTKLIKGSSGDVSRVIGSFTNPVRDILRDVRNVSNQAIGIVNLANNSIHNITNQITNLDRDTRNTIALLKKTGGIITSSPKTIASSIRELFNAGKMPLTSKFIVGKLSNGGHIVSKVSLLNSGKKHTPEMGAKL